MQINSINASANNFNGLYTKIVFCDTKNNKHELKVKEIKNYTIGRNGTNINYMIPTNIPFDTFQRAYRNALLAPSTLKEIVLNSDGK